MDVSRIDHPHPRNTRVGGGASVSSWRPKARPDRRLQQHDRAVFGPALSAGWPTSRSTSRADGVRAARGRSRGRVPGPESDQYALRVGRVRTCGFCASSRTRTRTTPFSRIRTWLTWSPGWSAPRARFAGSALPAWACRTSPRRLPCGRRCPTPNGSMCRARDLRPPSLHQSAAEIAVIRHAYQLAEAGIDPAVAAIHPGATERGRGGGRGGDAPGGRRGDGD